MIKKLNELRQGAVDEVLPRAGLNGHDVNVAEAENHRVDDAGAVRRDSQMSVAGRDDVEDGKCDYSDHLG